MPGVKTLTEAGYVNYKREGKPFIPVCQGLYLKWEVPHLENLLSSRQVKQLVGHPRKGSQGTWTEPDSICYSGCMNISKLEIEGLTGHSRGTSLRDQGCWTSASSQGPSQ